MLPLRFGTADEFSALRGYLQDAGFTTDAVCRRADVPSIYEFRTLREGRSAGSEIADEVDLLIRLFMDGASVDAATIDDTMRDDGFRALTSLGLLSPQAEEPDRFAATVLLYPTEDLFIVSDCGPAAPGLRAPDEPLPADVVYAAITHNTRNFLRTLPDTPCDALLDLGTGTGIAALIGARSATHVWAVDITDRAAGFAEFNRQLNAVENVTVLQGDLYAPVAGLTFDRIVTHPPYVPSNEQRYIYAHAGHDGEDVIRRIVAGLPEHLRPGGRFYCTCVSTDRREAPLEQRVRAMLGADQAGFDVLVVEQHSFHPSEFYLRLAAIGQISFQKAEQGCALVKSLEAERTVYCSLVLQRHSASRPPTDVRRDRAEQAGTREIEWLLDWTAGVAEDDLLDGLLEAYPVVSPHARLQVTHRPEDGSWRANQCQLVTEYPFPRSVELSASAAMLVATCDGAVSTRDRLLQLREQGAVPDEMSEEAFARFVQRLVTEGVLELRGFRIPAPVP